MRRNLNGLVALVALVVASSILQGSTLSAQVKKPVKVKADCPKTGDGKFAISVDPFEVEVKQDEGVEWSLDNDKNLYIRVTAKNPDDWLYEETTVKGSKTVSMTKMKSGADGIYHYKITVYCGTDDKTDPVVLDPRVKAGGG